MTTPHDFEAALQARIDGKTKPLGALGRIEALAAQIARMQGSLTPRLESCRLILFAGDHGIEFRLGYRDLRTVALGRRAIDHHRAEQGVERAPPSRPQPRVVAKRLQVAERVRLHEGYLRKSCVKRGAH